MMSTGNLEVFATKTQTSSLMRTPSLLPQDEEQCGQRTMEVLRSRKMKTGNKVSLQWANTSTSSNSNKDLEKLITCSSMDPLQVNGCRQNESPNS